MRQCALCEQEIAADSRSVLCPACQESNRTRDHRMASFDDVRGSLKIALARITAFQAEFPDAAPLVERARLALAETFPPLDTIRRELHRADDEVDKRLQAAHKAKIK